MKLFRAAELLMPSDAKETKCLKTISQERDKWRSCQRT